MKKRSLTLFQWIWQSYLHTAITPLILAVILFVSVYVLSNVWIRQESSRMHREASQHDILNFTEDEAITISNRLNAVADLVSLYASQAGVELQRFAELDPADSSRLDYGEGGVYKTLRDRSDGGAAIYYSGLVPVEEPEREKVAQLLETQSLLRDIYDTNPLVAAIYLNTHDSLNIIYPYHDFSAINPPGVDITQYNFYYLADAAHNPDRSVVWTDVYLDPGEQGWVTSSVAPVYRDDFLEGVAGIDLKLASLIDDFLSRDVPDDGYALLIGSDGTLLALPAAGEEDWNLEERTEHHYQEAILQDTFKPSDFNLNNRPGMEALSQTVESAPSGTAEIDMNGSARIVSWATVPETGWKLLTVVEEGSIQAAAEAMIQRILMIGSVMLISLVLAYAVYFIFLFRKAHKTSIRIASPLIKISNMARRIGQGEYTQDVPEIPVVELNNTASIVAETGRQLGDSTQSLLETQEILRKSEQDIRALIRAVEDMILVVDKNGSVQHVWRKEDENGEPHSGTDSRWLTAYFPSDVTGRILEHVRNVLKTGATATLEYRKEDEPDTRWFQVRISPVDQALQTVVLSLRDITDRIQSEHEAMQAKEEAESANRAKSRFLSSMSHELRTPLNAVLGYAQLLSFSDESDQDEETQHAAQEIIRAGRHLLSLIDRILELTKTEADRSSMVLEPLCVSDIIMETVDLIRPMADKRGIRITVEPGAYCSRAVQADPTRVRQILINLLTNAVKYNRKNGTVDIYCNREGNRVRFNIVDTGHGIPEAETQQIFEPFYRLPYREGESEGTGIGLAISRQLVEDMGGHIGVVSEEGAGSRFWFSLPEADTED